jgi:hypothetical protein
VARRCMDGGCGASPFSRRGAAFTSPPRFFLTSSASFSRNDSLMMSSSRAKPFTKALHGTAFALHWRMRSGHIHLQLLGEVGSGPDVGGELVELGLWHGGSIIRAMDTTEIIEALVALC